ncbi:MAG: OmpA family protein [Pseudomonadota bacterium]
MATDLQRMDRVGSTRRRYWRRLREPLDEWWPRGWLLLAGLFVLFFIGTFVRAPLLERDVQAAVVAALEDAGFEVVTADASGQGVTIRIGRVPDPQRVLAQARAVARGAECSTWLGPLICPTRIRLDQAPIEPDADPDAAVASPDQLNAPRYHDLLLEREGDRLRISGEVDSEDSKVWVLARVRSGFPEAEEALAVSGDTATPMYRSAVDRALSLLAPLLRGTVRWETGKLSLKGLVLPEQRAAAEAASAAVEPALNPQPPELSMAKTRDLCASEVAAALDSATLGFATASSAITADSTTLLDRLAELAAECPGSLVVEGHTDNSGAADANLALSRRRAEAVRLALVERGVSASRLRAEGYGESQPIADNATPDGRSVNRRIVVRLDR